MIFADLIQTASSLPTDASALESSISALERAISALESEVKALETSSAPWEYSVWAFTFLVVVGVVMELLVIRQEYLDDKEEWALAHFGIRRFPSKPTIPRYWKELVSVLLITIGIAGELGVGIKITSINGALRGKSAVLRSKNGELRSKSDELVALTGEGTARALAEAATANERSQRLESGNLALRGQVAGLEKEAAQLGLQLTERKLELEKEQEARLRLEAEIAPRNLDFTRAKNRLSLFGGVDVVLEYVIDQEARKVAGMLAGVFQQTGWKVISYGPLQVPQGGRTALPQGAAVGPVTMVGPGEMQLFREGIWIEARMTNADVQRLGVGEPTAWIAARELMYALADDHIGSTVAPADLPPNVVKVFVGFKPNVDQNKAMLRMTDMIKKRYPPR